MIEGIFTEWEIKELWTTICVPEPPSFYHKKREGQDNESEKEECLLVEEKPQE